MSTCGLHGKSKRKQLCIRIHRTSKHHGLYVTLSPVGRSLATVFSAAYNELFSPSCSLSANPLHHYRFESDVTRNILEKCLRIGHL